MLEVESELVDVVACGGEHGVEYVAEEKGYVGVEAPFGWDRVDGDGVFPGGEVGVWDGLVVSGVGVHCCVVLSCSRLRFWYAMTRAMTLSRLRM